MSTRTIHLVSARQSSRQRAHFSIFVPSAADSTFGTKIHVTGAPMVGYVLEFKRNYSPATDPVPNVTTPIGEISSSHVNDHAQNDSISTGDEPKDDLERAAAQIPTPRISENFLAPVNDITNRRCQEWTMDYVRHLVKLGYLDETAIEIVQARRDPPSFGVGLKPTAER